MHYGCPGVFVFLAIFAQLTPEMCATAWNRKHFTKKPFLHFKVIDVDTLKKLVKSSSPMFVMLCSMAIPTCLWTL